MNKAYLILGSNLGDRFENIRQSYKHINSGIGAICSASKIYETEPWGIKDQPHFLNLVVCIETSLDPYEILKEIDYIEVKLGRVRGEKWGERIIDIDILFFNELILKTGDVIIPHPLIQQRMFVLKPLTEIAGDLIHPVLKKSISELIEGCKDPLIVNEFKRAILHANV